MRFVRTGTVFPNPFVYIFGLLGRSRQRLWEKLLTDGKKTSYFTVVHRIVNQRVWEKSYFKPKGMGKDVFKPKGIRLLVWCFTGASNTL